MKTVVKYEKMLCSKMTQLTDIELNSFAIDQTETST